MSTLTATVAILTYVQAWACLLAGLWFVLRERYPLAIYSVVYAVFTLYAFAVTQLFVIASRQQ